MNAQRHTVRFLPWFTAVAACLVSACSEVSASEGYAVIGVVIGTPVDAQRTTWDQPVKEHYPALESGGIR